jgi:hypothetical protein
VEAGGVLQGDGANDVPPKICLCLALVPESRSGGFDNTAVLGYAVRASRLSGCRLRSGVRRRIYIRREVYI